MKGLRWFLAAVGVVAAAPIITAAMAPAPVLAYPILDPSNGQVRDFAGYPSWGADIKVDVTSTSTTAGLAALTQGFYIIVCTKATHADQGTTGVTATTSERLIPALSPYPLRVKSASESYVAFVRDAEDGVCVVSRESIQ